MHGGPFLPEMNYESFFMENVSWANCARNGIIEEFAVCPLPSPPPLRGRGRCISPQILGKIDRGNRSGPLSRAAGEGQGGGNRKPSKTAA
ncbi:hypothetical protein [Azospirillum doebereinerae]